MLSLILGIAGAVWLGVGLVRLVKSDYIEIMVTCSGLYLCFLCFLVTIWALPFAGYSHNSSQFTISSVEITEVTPLEEGGVYQVGDCVIYLDRGEIYSHHVTNEVYTPLAESYQVRQIENIHGEEMYELVKFDVPRGKWIRWWGYEDRWVVRKVRR